MPKQCDYCEDHTATVRTINHNYNQWFETDICQASDYLDDDEISYVNKFRPQWGRYTRCNADEQDGFEEIQEKLKVKTKPNICNLSRLAVQF